MKKLMSLLMVLAMSSNAAFATTNNSAADHNKMIAKTFNEFRYKMTVNLDPNDSQYQAKAITEFKGRMADLQAKGISSDEIMNFTRSTMLDAATRADFDRMISSMNVGQVSSEEAGNLAMQFMAARYQQGANYSGGGKASMKIALIVIGVVIVGVVTYLVVKHYKEKKSKTVTDTVTKTETTTDTETQTNTVTDTETDTETQTNTVTDTQTNTVTDTLTNTLTNTVTNTLTNTLTNTVTNTLTNTVTNTLTNTVTVTNTNTNTHTYTNTNTNTYTNTNTNTNTHGNCSHNYSYGNCYKSSCPNRRR